MVTSRLKGGQIEREQNVLIRCVSRFARSHGSGPFSVNIAEGYYIT